VLGRNNELGASRHDGFWMNNAVMNKIREFLKNRIIGELETYVDRLNAVSLAENLADPIAALESIAIQLEKAPPVVALDLGNIYLRAAAPSLVADVCTHVLRNAIDHGIETAAVRIASGKNPRGTIDIRAELEQENLVISVCDDGRGLNIQSVLTKGINLGIWQPGETPALADIAKIIFHSGITTKEQVGEISGRGGGMNAVQQFMAERGGQVALKLHPERAIGEGDMPFELILIFPPELFFVAAEGG
jgi:two-component system chemotaxis sensor kinase CheA